MECVHCGRDAFNRIVVDPTTGEERGGLCEECDASAFGVLASEPLWRQDEGCGLCPGPADVSLPRLDCLVEWDDGTVEAEYEAGDALHLCTDHLAALLEPEDQVPVHPVKSRA